MPVNKKALSRYLIIDKCLRNTGRKYYFPDLLNEINRCLKEEGFEGIGRTQLYKDLNDLEFSTYKAPIVRKKDGRKTYFRYGDPDYSISNQPVNEDEANQIREALVVLSRFKGMPQFEWVHELIPRLEQSFQLKTDGREIISFDSNEFLTGIEYLGPLFNAILYKQVLKVRYKSFKSEEPSIFTFEPHYLKQFNNRWFLLGYNKGFDNISTIALDRILDIKDCDEEYQERDHSIFFDYFEDIIGVTRFEERDCEKVVLKFTAEQSPYVLTKPLHGSQKIVEETEAGLIISLELIHNYELETLILGFGEKVEVFEPSSLRNQIKERILKTKEIYSNDSR